MAEAIVSKIAKILDDFAKDGKLLGFDDVFHKIKKTVSTLQSVVHDAENRSLEDLEIEAWLDDLKAAFYDAEDLLEEWSIEAMRQGWPSKDAKLKQVNTLFSDSNELALELESVRERIEAIDTRRKNLKLRKSAKYGQVGRGSRKRKRSDPVVAKEEIIGRDGGERALAPEGAFYSDMQEYAEDVQVESGSGKGEQSESIVTEEAIIRRDDAKRAITPEGAYADLREYVKDVQVERGSRIGEQSESVVTEEAIIRSDGAKRAITPEGAYADLREYAKDVQVERGSRIGEQSESVVTEEAIIRSDGAKRAITPQDAYADLREYAKDVQVERGSRIGEQSESVVTEEAIIRRDGAKGAIAPEGNPVSQFYWKDVQVERGSRKGEQSESVVTEEAIIRRDGANRAMAPEGTFYLNLREYAKDLQVERGSRKGEQSESTVTEQAIIRRHGAKRGIAPEGAYSDLSQYAIEEQSESVMTEEAIIRRDGAKRAMSLEGLREYAKDVQVERELRKGEQSESIVNEEPIIGRDGAKSAIMKFLLDSEAEENFSLISIWGKQGIGKTALARCLYKDDLVNRHFDLRIWVCVGDGVCDLKRVLQKIIKCATTEKADDIELEQLQNQLLEHIRGKKYLLVMDDVSWPYFSELRGSLNSLLMGGAEGSKILITTHNESVMNFWGTSSSYFLENLSESSSLDLLMRMACNEEKTRDLKKLTLGRQIVKKCDGIPLAIRTIGSILFFKETEAEWFLLEHEIPEVSPWLEHYGVTAFLEFSYQHLPSHLKQCFAFCSLFPRDWVIDKLLLTSLWIAEGFIQAMDSGDRAREDVAHDYFMGLLRRNFFQDCAEDELGNVTSCKMHGVTNELACMVARTEYSQHIYQSSSSIGERTRHLSWDSTLDLSQGLPSTLLKAKHLRTFIKMDHTKSSRCETQMGGKTLQELISSFKFMRALDLHDSGIAKLPSSICELKHLTFLDLSENEGIISLPDSMTRLQTLQVLKLNMCYNLIELPRDIRKLVNLRQLEISNCNALSHMPHGLGQLTLLHTLTDFICPGDESRPKNCGGLGELNRLNNLRGSLRIEIKGEIEDVVAESTATNLKEKYSLVSLVLAFAGKESDQVLLKELKPSLNLRILEIRGYGGTRFPSWMSRMPELVELRLFHCTGCKCLPPLGELTSLKRFEIGELPIVEYTESDLHTLSSLPNLSALRIWNCPNMERIPPLLQLKELKLPSFPLESLETSVATIEHVIGIDGRVKDVIKLLEMEDHKLEVRIVGIHGTNGIGKTTIAKAVYDRLSSCFDSRSFLAEIGETARNVGGFHFVQTKLISDILERGGEMASFKGGIKFFLDVFRNIKVLIVLDDVEELSHIYDLVGDQLDWFGSGSRIIVTSENGGILQTYLSRGLACTYEVNEMDNDQAFELFCKHALGTHISIPGYSDIGKSIVKATGHVPLVIEVIGSFLCGKPIRDWRKIECLIEPQKENFVGILKDCREILKICHEELHEKQKQIFWDIAWFANGVDSQIASYMWPNQDLLHSHCVLMPLAKIGENNKLWMHKLLKCLSKTVDKKEFSGRRSILQVHDTDLKVIDGEEGLEEVEAFCFDFKNGCLHTFTETNFKSMPNIRFLKLDHASMAGNFANVFPKLRWLRWQGCPRDFEATEFNLTELVILDLSWSKVTGDWGGWRKIKMEQLKVLNLTGCTDLLISPTFSSFPNLEILILEQCSRLVHLDPSVGGLKNLLCLNLKSCTELNMLPAELGGLESLKELLVDETSVQEIPLKKYSDSNWLSLNLQPQSFGHLTSLSILSVNNSKITELPDEVGELVKLQRLSLRNCLWIRELPKSIGQLGSSLEELDISGTGVSNLPCSFGNLQSLRVLKMDYCFISKFPSFIGCLRSLEEIHASSCRSLKGKIPRDIGKLVHLRILRLQYSGICSLPSEIKHLSNLETLDLLHCDMLRELPALPSRLVTLRFKSKIEGKNV